MKLNTPKNANYAATVVEVKQIIELDNCDNVVAVPLLGYRSIVGKDVKVGDVGILFGAEAQLSVAYAKANNLHRHSDLNADPNWKGYLEDNRRIKAIRFRGHRSDALFMPLESLSDFTDDWAQLKVGDTFDEIGGVEICRKYEVPGSGSKRSSQATPKSQQRLDEIHLPKHFDTPNYFRNPNAIGPDDFVVATQKLHGTSVRIGHSLVKRKLGWLEKLAKKLGVQVREMEYDYVYGSRNVIKDPGNPSGPGFYGADLYAEVGSRLKGLLPKGWVVYGEIIGWVPGTNTPIQKGYTYQIPQGEAELYVYRITTVNEDGRAVDLSWPAIQEFCDSIGAKSVPEITDFLGNPEFEIDDWLDKRFADYNPDAVPTDGDSVDEGLCLRVEGITPTIVKAKSPEFLRFESKQFDAGTVDIESAEEVAA
jgi:hypothetical protein